jgi:enoyl-CoA hydratase/carnithine racemase
MDKYIAILDEIEAQKPQDSIIVTLGVGPAVFCSGFDLNFIKKNPMNIGLLAIKFMEMQSKLIQMDLPTICVCNGSAMGPGLFLAATHDRII